MIMSKDPRTPGKTPVGKPGSNRPWKGGRPPGKPPAPGGPVQPPAPEEKDPPKGK
jgi:hypothetical protein